MSTAARSRRDGLTGPQRCAVLCIALGATGAAGVLRQLPPDDVEKVTRAIAAMPSPDPELVRSVVEEYREAARRNAGSPRGGPGFASQVLEEALGAARARPLLARLASPDDSGLGRLRQAAPQTLAGLLRDEHPQTVAVVASQLEDAAALALLRSLEPERSREVMWRLARLAPVSAETLSMIERELLSRLGTPPASAAGSASGGPERVARLLNLGGEEFEQPMLETLERLDRDLADRVRRLLFTFEDLLRVDGRGVQRVLREIDGKELALALKVASDELRQHLRKGMSERAAAALDEEIEMMGAVRVKEVEAAHARIIETVRSLAQAGEIAIQGVGGTDEMV